MAVWYSAAAKVRSRWSRASAARASAYVMTDVAMIVARLTSRWTASLPDSWTYNLMGLLYPNTPSPAVLKHARCCGLPVDRRRTTRPRRFPAAPLCVPLFDQCIYPLQVGSLLRGYDSRDRSTTGHNDQARASAYSLEMAAQMRLEFTNPDSLHDRPRLEM